MERPALARAAMQWLDRRAIEHYGIPEIVLMENAGAGVAHLALEMLAHPRGARVHVLCGRGNNGGDGFVAARRLADAGVDARVFVAGGADRIRPGGAAHLHWEVVRRLGIPSLEKAHLARDCDLLVDALFGTGLDRPLGGDDLEFVRAVNASGLPVLAVDVPSGLDADTGEPLGAAIRARQTAALAFPKIGFARGQGPDHTGRVAIVDIGIPVRAFEDLRREWGDRAFGQVS